MLRATLQKRISFRYATEQSTGSKRDDFSKKDDPFWLRGALYFVVPFAFEPGVWATSRRCSSVILATQTMIPKRPGRQREETGRCGSLFSDYLRMGLYDLDSRARKGEAQAYEGPRSEQSTWDYATQKAAGIVSRVSFGDGGYLDNSLSATPLVLMRVRRRPCRSQARLRGTHPVTLS